MTDAPPPLPPLPDPVLRRPGGWRFSLIWLVPLVAASIGLVLVLRAWLETGPTIRITFESAEGLAAGKTEVRYKDVAIGEVEAIALSDDASKVVVQVQMAKSAARLAASDTRFWVVRPRIGVGGVSGISTLLSGAYIAVDIGESTERKTDFVGLEKPPTVLHDRKGRRFTLHADEAGSITIGAPVYYKRVPVGQVTDAALDEDGRHLTVQVFVEAPYDRFVTHDARFWNAGGVDLALSSTGFKLNTQSLATVLAGGIAFQPLREDSLNDRADENTDFQLYPDKATALAPIDGPAVPIVLVFAQSTRGLSVGATVDFQGISLGEVERIEPEYDPSHRSFLTRVLLRVYPERLGPAYRTLAGIIDDDSGDEAPKSKTGERILERFVSQGLGAQLRVGNLLTGQQYVALFFQTGAKQTTPERRNGLLRIPTAAGNLEELQSQIQSIVRKIDGIPFQAIGEELRGTLGDSRALLKRLDGEVAPQAKQMLNDASHALKALDANLASPEAAIQQDTRRTLRQIDRAAASLRALSDYLEQHPEALLRGKPDAEPPASAAVPEPSATPSATPAAPVRAEPTADAPPPGGAP